MENNYEIKEFEKAIAVGIIKQLYENKSITTDYYNELMKKFN